MSISPTLAPTFLNTTTYATLSIESGVTANRLGLMVGIGIAAAVFICLSIFIYYSYYKNYKYLHPTNAGTAHIIDSSYIDSIYDCNPTIITFTECITDVDEMRTSIGSSNSFGSSTSSHSSLSTTITVIEGIAIEALLAEVELSPARPVSAIRAPRRTRNRYSIVAALPLTPVVDLSTVSSSPIMSASRHINTAGSALV